MVIKLCRFCIHVDLLLDRGKFDQLLGELIGIERIERILVLQLRGQELQKRIEITGQLLRGIGAGGLSNGRAGRTRTGGRRTDLVRRENRSRVGDRVGDCARTKLLRRENRSRVGDRVGGLCSWANLCHERLNANIEAAAEPSARVNLRSGGVGTAAGRSCDAD